jgi:hypothetical protein
MAARERVLFTHPNGERGWAWVPAAGLADLPRTFRGVRAVSTPADAAECTAIDAEATARMSANSQEHRVATLRQKISDAQTVTELRAATLGLLDLIA